MLHLFIVLAWIFLGYALGRVRPWERLSEWTWGRMTFGSPWNDSWPKQALVMAALVLTEPRRVYDALRHPDPDDDPDDNAPARRRPSRPSRTKGPTD